MRIREGNDFNVAWKIFQAGAAVDLSQATKKKLTFSVLGKKIEHTNYTVSGQTLMIEFPKEVTTENGDYRLIFEYTIPDSGQSDKDLKRTTDVVAFRIVPFTADADTDMTVNVSSDVAIAFKGDRGDPGYDAYHIWLDLGNTGTYEDYIAWQRQPAVDAAASISTLEQIVSDNEGLRVTAEKGRFDAELLREEAESARSDAEGLRDGAEELRIAAEGIRDENETDRINAESDREDAEDLRDQAEVAREGAEIARANAEGDATKGRVKAENERVTAEGLRDEAEELRELAEIARANAEGDAMKGRVKAENDRVAAEILRNETFDQKIGEADGKIEEMDTTLSTYEGRMSQAESDIDQLADDVEGTIEMPIAHALSQLKEEIDSLRILIEEGRINRMQIETLDVISEIRINGSPLIYVRDSAPSFSPDQVPQFYIDTSAGRFYAAKGTGSANDWF